MFWCRINYSELKAYWNTFDIRVNELIGAWILKMSTNVFNITVNDYIICLIKKGAFEFVITGRIKFKLEMDEPNGNCYYT